MDRSTSSTSSLSPVASADYVAAVAQHVSSVCVITTTFEGIRYGLTATAVSSVSADPPRLLVCVNKNGLTHEKIRLAGRFCVNVLAEGQDTIGMVFAGMGGNQQDRFSTGAWTMKATGAPVLEGAAASFDCVLVEMSDQSTHTVFFGEVVAADCIKGQDTLLYGARRFRQLRKIFAGFSEGGDEYL